MNHPYSGNAYTYASRDYYAEYQDPISPPSITTKTSGLHSFLPSQSLDSLLLPKSTGASLPQSSYGDETSAILSPHPYNSITSYSDVGHGVDSPYTGFTGDSLLSRSIDSPVTTHSQQLLRQQSQNQHQRSWTNHDRKRDTLLRTQRSLDSFTAQVLDKGLPEDQGHYYFSQRNIFESGSEPLGLGPTYSVSAPSRSQSHSGHTYASAINGGGQHRRSTSERARMPLEPRRNLSMNHTTPARRKPAPKIPDSFVSHHERGVDRHRRTLAPMIMDETGPRWDAKSVTPSTGWDKWDALPYKHTSPWARLSRTLRRTLKKLKRILANTGKQLQ